MSMNPTHLAAGSQANAQANAQAALKMQTMQNRHFMALSLNKEALCQQSNGGANAQSFGNGQPLTYNVTTTNNGFLTGFWVRCSLTVNLSAGTSAVYALNAAAPLSLIDNINVMYGGVQHNFRPYMLKYLSQMQKANGQPQPRQVVAGQQSTYLQSYYNSAPYSTAVGNNTYNFAFYMPMNLIHPQDVRGILPIQNGETTCQIVINCAPAPYGPDPVINTFVTTSGSGGAATVTGNIAVIATYKDGQSYSQLTALQPNLSGIETAQLLRDTPLNSLGTGQVFRNKISYLHKIAYLWLTVIDGQQSSKFATTANFQRIETTADAVGNRAFIAYGNNTNLDPRGFFDEVSGQMGGLLQQDLDEGILPLVYGPLFQQADAGILEGQHYLDMTIGSGWTDFHYGLQLSAVGSVAGISPRVEPTMVVLNTPLVM